MSVVLTIFPNAPVVFYESFSRVMFLYRRARDGRVRVVCMVS